MSIFNGKTFLRWGAVALFLFAFTACMPLGFTPSPPLEHTVTGETPSGVAYKLPLTVQYVSEISATLYFELERPAEGELLYWISGQETHTSRVPFTGTEARHQVTLIGLEPGTEYRAVVVLDDGAKPHKQPAFLGREWGTVGFRTVSEGQPLRVGVIGDSGPGEGDTLELVERMAAYDLDFVLHTGGVVYSIEEHEGPFEAYAEKYFAPLAPLLHEMPVYPVVGDHDTERAAIWQGAPFYYYAFPPFAAPGDAASDFEGQNKWYSVAYGSFQFLLLNTQALFGEGGPAYQEQNAWLAERLADDRFDHTIPVFHTPIFSSGPSRSEGLVVQGEWGDLFATARVPIVLSGHERFYERLSVEGLTYIVSGGGSPGLHELDKRLPESRSYASRMHFVLLELHADRIKLSAVALDGEFLDQAVIPLKLSSDDRGYGLRN